MMEKDLVEREKVDRGNVLYFHSESETEIDEVQHTLLGHGSDGRRLQQPDDQQLQQQTVSDVDDDAEPATRGPGWTRHQRRTMPRYSTRNVRTSTSRQRKSSGRLPTARKGTSGLDHSSSWSRMKYVGLECLQVRLNELKLNHKDFLRSMRLEDFFGLEWDRPLEMGIIQEFLENYNPKTMKTALQDLDIDLGKEFLGKVFSLPDGTFELPSKIPFTSENFPESSRSSAGYCRFKRYKIAEAKEPWYTRYAFILCLFALKDTRAELTRSLACWVESGDSDHNLRGAFHQFFHKELGRIRQLNVDGRTPRIGSTFIGLHILLIHDHFFPKSPHCSNDTAAKLEAAAASPTRTTGTQLLTRRPKTTTTPTILTTLNQKDPEDRAIEELFNETQASILKLKSLHVRRVNNLKTHVVGLKTEAHRADQMERKIHDLKASHSIAEEALKRQLVIETKRLEHRSNKLQKKYEAALQVQGDLVRRYETALGEKNAKIRRTRADTAKHYRQKLHEIIMKIQTMYKQEDNQKMPVDLEQLCENALGDQEMFVRKVEAEEISGNVDVEVFQTKKTKKRRT